MKVLVCGGRHYSERGILRECMDYLDAAFDIDTVVHGDASGADTLVLEWALLRGKEVVSYPADWDKHGRAAGPIRNQQMLDEEKPDMVVAFPGGRGTGNMKSLAKKGGFILVDLDHLHRRNDEQEDNRENGW